MFKCGKAHDPRMDGHRSVLTTLDEKRVAKEKGEHQETKETQVYNCTTMHFSYRRLLLAIFTIHITPPLYGFNNPDFWK